MAQLQRNPHSDWVGRTIADRYKIEAVLGRGGMSTVYQATDPNLKRTVAVKLIHPHLSVDPEFVHRFEQEAAAVARLRHPNIIQVYDFDHDGDTYYMVLEYVPGQTLQAKLKSLNAVQQRFPLQQTIRIMTTMSDAVAYAHERSMIHRDLKPANVMLNLKEEPILMDFGVAKMLGEVHYTATGAIIGTAKYMAPEQAQSARADGRADIYSLGVMLYEMTAGSPPFEGESAVSIMMKHVNEPLPNVRKFHNDVPDELVKIIEKALAKFPTNRYQSAAELSHALRATGLASTPSKDPVTVPSFKMEDYLPPEDLTSITPPPVVPNKQPVRAAQQTNVLKWVVGLGAAVLVCGLISIVGVLQAGQWFFSPEAQTLAETQPQAVAAAEESLLPDSIGMVRVAAGTYNVGVEKPDSEHAPRQSVELNEFWLDRHEVKNAQYAQFLAATDNQPVPGSWAGGTVPVGQEDHPVQGVTWDMAAAYCEWAKKRLPAEAEWEIAARGKQGWLYPWGDDERAVELPRAGTYNVGTVRANRSPFGAFDMAGNVWEWVGDPYAPVESGNQVLRGGAHGFLQDMAYRLQGDPTVPTMSATAGFRCAADNVNVIENANVLFSDDFTDPESGWPALTEGTNLFGYHPPDFYHVEVGASNKSQVVSRGPAFENVTVESNIFVAKTNSENGNFRYGLVLRRSGNDYYAFAVSNRSDTWYVLKNSATGLQVLREGTADSIQGQNRDTADVLRVDADGSQFIFHINGQPVTVVKDADYSGGEIGFFIENFDQTLAHVHYDTLRIRDVDLDDTSVLPSGVLSYDDFTDPQSGWPALDEGSNLIGYHPPDFYHVEVGSPGESSVVSHGPILDNVTVESDMFIAKSNTENGDFRYGLVIRRTGADYYAFTVSSRTKNWSVLKSSAGKPEILAEGVDDTIAGQDSSTANRLRVDAEADRFVFHINGRPVVEVTSGDYAAGEVGFFVENFDESLSHVHFDTLTIREVDFVEGAPTAGQN